jgi:hypothetical protein
VRGDKDDVVAVKGLSGGLEWRPGRGCHRRAVKRRKEDEDCGLLFFSSPANRYSRVGPPLVAAGVLLG